MSWQPGLPAPTVPLSSWARRRSTFFRSFTGVKWIDAGPDSTAEQLALEVLAQDTDGLAQDTDGLAQDTDGLAQDTDGLAQDTDATSG